MSNGLIDRGKRASARGCESTPSMGARAAWMARVQKGAGMLEFFVALLIFSMGMLGLLSAQWVGKKTAFEASQRSVATALVRDILERMRANPGQLEAYQAGSLGDEVGRITAPEIDCDVMDCTAAELALFDLWQWESLLLGDSEQDLVGSAGGLVAPRACISSAGGAVNVTISWRGVLHTSDTEEPIAVEACEATGDGVPIEDTGEQPQRHFLSVSTFIAGRG